MSHVPWHVGDKLKKPSLLERAKGAVGGLLGDVKDAASAVASGDVALPIGPHGHKLDVGHATDLKDGVVGFMKYGFAPLDTKEKIAAVAKWSLDPTASYEDMPPGAMNVELPAGLMPGPGDLQALRDIWRDFSNGDVGFWTLVDGVSVIPGAIGAGGFLLGMMREGDKLGDLGRKFAKQERELRAATRGKSGEVYVGKPGDIHGNVDDMIPAHDKPDYMDPSAQGFKYSDDADPKHMMSREEAGREIGVPDDDPQLDALDLRKINLSPAAAARSFRHIGAEEFVGALKKAEDANPRVKDFHTSRSLDDWKQLEADGAKFYLNESGDIGSAVLPDGDMVNAFNFADPATGKGVVGEVLFPLMIKEGGTKADWFDTRLSKLYEPYMDVVDRYPYDPKYGSKVARDEYSQFAGGGDNMADVVQGRVRPEVQQRLGVPEPEGGWRGAKASHERALTDFRMKDLLGFDASEIMDVGGMISPRALRQGFTKSDEIEGALRDAGALERGSNFNRLWHHYLDQLDPAEAERIAGRPIRDRFVALTQYSRNLPPESLAAMTAMGHRGKGWYEATAKSFAGMFGEDAPQVAALVASLSPNVSVKANTRMAMDLWSEWAAAGRPRDPDAIQNLFNMVRANAGPNTLRPSFADGPGHQVVSNAINNVQRVLGQTDPVDFFSDPKLWKAGNVLSGPKVDPFFANLMGEFGRFTNDTHMNRLSGMKRNSLTNRAAQTAAYQDAADVLQKNLGLEGDDVLQIANMQEMPWGVGRQMPLDASKAGGGTGRGYGGTEEHFFPGGGDIDPARYAEAQRGAAEAPDIAELLHEPETAANLQRAGYDPAAANARRGGVRDPVAMDEFALSNQEGIRRATRRMDMHNAGDYLMGLTGLLGGAVGARAVGGLLDEERR